MVQAVMDRAGRIGWCLGSLIAAGCASPAPEAQTPQPAAQSPAAAQSAGAEQPAKPIDGLWVEFWALEGHADTQRYALFEDGRFGWCAASDGPAHGARRWGQWSAQGDTLVLRVRGQDSGKSCDGGSCRVQHEPPLEERLQLGPCPPNEEAKALDASYRCISIAGQAFWRRARAEDPAAYFPN